MDCFILRYVLGLDTEPNAALDIDPHFLLFSVRATGLNCLYSLIRVLMVSGSLSGSTTLSH